jgi:hypothetical protein
VLRGQRVMPDGRVRDTVVYSILDREWPGVKRNLETMLMRGWEAGMTAITEIPVTQADGSPADLSPGGAGAADRQHRLQMRLHPAI